MKNNQTIIPIRSDHRNFNMYIASCPKEEIAIELYFENKKRNSNKIVPIEKYLKK